jgi:hypothetical protein
MAAGGGNNHGAYQSESNVMKCSINVNEEAYQWKAEENVEAENEMK